MPLTLGDIPLGTPIVDEDSTINVFFRQRWDELQRNTGDAPTAAVVEASGQTAAIATADAYLTVAAGVYRISYYMRKTTADGVSSSLQVTVGWLEHAVPLTETFAALLTDTTQAQQSGSKLVYADAESAITYAVAYASNTPGTMAFFFTATVERLV